MRRMEGRKVHARTIQRKKVNCRFKGNTNVTLHQARVQLQETYKRYSETLKHASDNRVTFLEDFAAARAKTGKIKACIELEKMRRVEKTKASWRRIHRMDGTEIKAGGLQRIISPDPNGSWTEKVTKDDVEKGTLSENERRFT